MKISGFAISIFIFLLIPSRGAFAQVVPDSIFPKEELNGNSLLLSRNLLAQELMEPYLKYQKILQYHDPVLYLTFAPKFDPIKTRVMPLAQGEGVKGYLLEGNIAHRINLYRGKYYSPGFFKKLRVTFDAGFNLRLTGDSSSFLLPASNIVGLGADYLITPVFKLLKPNKFNFWVRTQIHHYSNGQALGFFQSLNPRRNNYKDGDFSTNYFRVVFNSLMQNKKGYLFSGGLGYQREINIGGPLRLSEEFDKSFGLNRLLVNLQFTRTPSYTLVKHGTLTKYEQKRIQMNYRSELIYILDKDLSLYPSAKKYRIAAHNYFTVYPFLTNDVGVVFHHYIGRDYLNIRYDDVVNSYQFGLVLNFNK